MTRWAVYIGIAVGLLVIGFGVGRFLTPPQTVVTEKVVEVEKQVVVTQKETEVKVVYVKNTNESRNLYEKTTTKPSGEKVVEKSEVVSQQTQVVSAEHAQIAESQKATVEKSKESNKTTTPVVPKWELSLSAGYPISRDSLLSPKWTNAIMYGTVKRRVVGGVYGGAWLASDLTTGVVVEYNF